MTFFGPQSQEATYLVACTCVSPQLTKIELAQLNHGNDVQNWVYVGPRFNGVGVGKGKQLLIGTVPR